MALRLPSIKQGHTFVTTVEFDDLATTAEELKSQVRDYSNNLVADLEISAGDTPGVFVLTAINTTNWPMGNVFMDIRRTINSKQIYSDTIIIPVTGGVTR